MISLLVAKYGTPYQNLMVPVAKAGTKKLVPVELVRTTHTCNGGDVENGPHLHTLLDGQIFVTFVLDPDFTSCSDDIAVEDGIVARRPVDLVGVRVWVGHIIFCTPK